MGSEKQVLRTTRWEARITAEQKAMIERAAAYEGRSVSDFVAHSVQEAAKAVVREYETLRLNGQQSETLVQMLLEPPEPNAALQEAGEQYHRRVRRA